MSNLLGSNPYIAQQLSIDYVSVHITLVIYICIFSRLFSVTDFVLSPLAFLAALQMRQLKNNFSNVILRQELQQEHKVSCYFSIISQLLR